MKIFSLFAATLLVFSSAHAAPDLSAFDGEWIADGQNFENYATAKSPWCEFAKGDLARLSVTASTLDNETDPSQTVALFESIEHYNPSWDRGPGSNSWGHAFEGAPGFGRINEGPLVKTLPKDRLTIIKFKHESKLSEDGLTLTHTLEVWESFLGMLSTSPHAIVVETLQASEDGSQIHFTLTNGGKLTDDCTFTKK